MANVDPNKASGAASSSYGQEIDKKKEFKGKREDIQPSSPDDSKKRGVSGSQVIGMVKGIKKKSPQRINMRASFGGQDLKAAFGRSWMRLSFDGSDMGLLPTTDLQTAMDWKEAFLTGAFLMVFLSQDKKAVQEGEKSHEEVFKDMATATKDAMGKLDPQNKVDQKNLNALGDQWKKAFSPKKGGMGRLPDGSVDLRKPLTKKLVTELKAKGVQGAEEGKTLKDCNITDLDVIKAFGGRDNIPKELQAKCDDTFDSCNPAPPGIGPFKEVPDKLDANVKVKLTDMTLKQIGLGELEMVNIFPRPEKVPAKYAVEGREGGKIDPNCKLDEDLINRIKSKGIRTEKQLETSRARHEGNLNIEAQRKNRSRQENIAHNKQVKQGLIDMLTFMEDNAASHFNPERNGTALKTASVQLYATMGQFYHDHILEGDEKLKEAFISKGLCTEDTLQMVRDFDKAGRRNPLLAEVENSDIKKALSDAVLSPGADSHLRDNLKQAFKSRLTEVNQEKQLGFEEAGLDAIAEELVDGFGQELKDVQTNLKMSNPRGRTKAEFAPDKKWRADEFAKYIRGEEGKNPSVMNMPQGSDDELVEGLVRNEVEDVDEHFSDPETVKGLKSGPPPKTLLRGGAGLDSKLVRVFNNPLQVLKKKLAKSGEGYPSPQVLLDQKLDASMVDALSGVIKKDDEGKLIYWKSAEGKTLKELGVSSDRAIEILVLYAFNNQIDSVPEEMKTDWSVNLEQKLDADMIEAFGEHVSIYSDGNRKFQVLVTKDGREILLKKGKSLRQLGVKSNDVRELFGGSMVKVPKKLRERRVDVNKGLSLEAYERLGGEEGKFNIPLSPKQRLLYGVTNEEINKDGLNKLKEDVQEQVGEVDVPYNKAVRGQTVKFSEFATQHSVKKIMTDYGLRTICSISGTTLDTIVGALSCMKDEDVDALLKPVIDHAQSLPELMTFERMKSILESKEPNLSDEDIQAKVIEENRRIMRETSMGGLEDFKGGEATKHFLSSVATLMQGGRYHTAGEVIGGLYIAARGKLASESENRDITETRELFTRLMVDFAENPEHYIPVGKPTKESFGKPQEKDELIRSLKGKLVDEAKEEIAAAEEERIVKKRNK